MPRAAALLCKAVSNPDTYNAHHVSHINGQF